jgi:putative Mg2+ transporter-C (MgtC) family protein
MSTGLTAREIALRLALTCIAGSLIGFNRDEHGRPAGLRTTLLVGLAAAIAMLQADLLMGSRGKPSDSFVVLDLMRLPLGILSGMGFIGAAAVFKRGDMVIGVTTAATLWFVTVMGLCFGGGQLGLGMTALLLGLGVLWLLKQLEPRMTQEHHATLQLTLGPGGPGDEELRRQLEAARLHIVSWSFQQQHTPEQRTIRCQVRWSALRVETRPPALVTELAQAPHVIALDWHA